MPAALNEDDGLIPFTKLMQINKIMHPRLNTEYLQRRRELYKSKDWEAYDRCVRDSFRQGIQVAESGYKALNKILGLTQGEV
jgi:hypothetical protein